MKTFLWTTLFWIVAAIAWLLCLGFWNLWTQALDNSRLVSVMPNNLKDKVCDPVVASVLEWVDWCAAAEMNNCYSSVEETENANAETWDVDIQGSLENILTNQQIIYNYLQESFASTDQAISNISINYVQPEVAEPVIDEREQQRQQLQAQIEALQNEMNNL